MTYYPDMTPYDYMRGEGCVTPARGVNVGWLDRDERFPTGDLHPGLIDALRFLVAFHTQNLTRGFHACPFCSPTPDHDPLTEPYEYAQRDQILLGNGELHIPGPDGVTFVAPTLVVHYIRDHHYLPPQAFINAAPAEAAARDLAWEQTRTNLPVGTVVTGRITDGYIGLYEVDLMPHTSARSHLVTRDDLEIDAPVRAAVSNFQEHGRIVILSPA